MECGELIQDETLIAETVPTLAIVLYYNPTRQNRHFDPFTWFESNVIQVQNKMSNTT